jgi:hypothetical protein
MLLSEITRKVLPEIPVSVGVVATLATNYTRYYGREKRVNRKRVNGYSGGFTSNRNKPIARSTILRKPNSTVNPARAVALEIVK